MKPEPVFRPGPITVREQRLQLILGGPDKRRAALAYLRLFFGRLESPSRRDVQALPAAWIMSHADTFTKFFLSQVEGEGALETALRLIHADRSERDR